MHLYTQHIHSHTAHCKTRSIGLSELCEQDVPDMRCLTSRSGTFKKEDAKDLFNVTTDKTLRKYTLLSESAIRDDVKICFSSLDYPVRSNCTNIK